MASEKKLTIQKLERKLYMLQSEKDNLVKALQYIRVLREKSKIERLQVNSKLREISAKKSEQDTDSIKENTVLLEESSAGPSGRQQMSVSLKGADLSFLDDPSVINQTVINLDVVSREELLEEELETEED